MTGHERPWEIPARSSREMRARRTMEANQADSRIWFAASEQQCVAPHKIGRSNMRRTVILKVTRSEPEENPPGRVCVHHERGAEAEMRGGHRDLSKGRVPLWLHEGTVGRIVLPVLRRTVLHGAGGGRAGCGLTARMLCRAGRGEQTAPAARTADDERKRDGQEPGHANPQARVWHAKTSRKSFWAGSI
jgi:hypothetical protein